MMDIHKILKQLPHRFPFLLVDRVLELDKGKRIKALKNVTINEPFFVGHFPHRPVMPGVLMLEALAQAAALQPATLRIIVSGQTMNRAMQAGLRKGEIHHYFEKQHSYEPVQACIRDWLAAQRGK